MFIPEQHRHILREVLPGEASETLSFRRGQFHDVIVGENLAISIAKTEAAAARLSERAQRLIAVSCLDLGIARPQVVSVHPSYLVMTRIPGAPLDLHQLAENSAVPSVAMQLVILLDALAAIDKERLEQCLVKPAAPDRWSLFAADTERHLFPRMTEAGRKRARRELSAVCSLPYMVLHLVHGDLGGSNIHWVLRDGEPQLAGVLDWDEVHAGDPAEDLASLLSGFGPEVTEAVIARLPPDASIRGRVKAIHGTFALQQALAAFKDGDAVELNDGLTGYT